MRVCRLIACGVFLGFMKYLTKKLRVNFKNSFFIKIMYWISLNNWKWRRHYIGILTGQHFSRSGCQLPSWDMFSFSSLQSLAGSLYSFLLTAWFPNIWVCYLRKLCEATDVDHAECAGRMKRDRCLKNSDKWECQGGIVS